jgi:hypothetical protein
METTEIKILRRITNETGGDKIRNEDVRELGKVENVCNRVSLRRKGRDMEEGH